MSELPYYDFQIVIRKSLNLEEVSDLNGAAIGVIAGTLTELELARYFGDMGFQFNPVVFSQDAELIAAYESGRMDALAVKFGDRALSLLSNPTEHVILDPDGRTLGPPVTVDQAVNIALLYEAGLGRPFDAPGLNYWIDRVEHESPFSELAANFLDSGEFTTRFGDDDAMSNEQFINVMYNNVLGRAAEGAGFDYWLAQMTAGAIREQLLQSFAVSPENRAGSQYLGTLQEVAPGYWDATIPPPPTVYPVAAIEIAAAYEPGDSVDLAVHRLEVAFEQQFGVDVMVRNYPVGRDDRVESIVRLAAADGYTLLFSQDKTAGSGLVRIPGTIDGSYGLFAPAGTSPEILQELSDAIQNTGARSANLAGFENLADLESFQANDVDVIGGSGTWIEV